MNIPHADKKSENPLDSLLLSIARDRDRDAFASLFDAIAPKLVTYLLRSGCEVTAAEELVQEVMLTVWRKADSFDPQQSNASTWIYRIARNRRIDQVRKSRQDDKIPAAEDLWPDAPLGADTIMQLYQEGSQIRSLLDDLPAEQSQLLQMAFYDEKSHCDIAKETGLPLGTVKSRIRLALEKMRKAMDQAHETQHPGNL